MIDIPVAILCGGKGTRLGELTRSTPKSLVKVAGRPFIFWQLGGYTAKHAKHCLTVPTVNEAHVTPFTESMQSVICHLLAFHPKLRVNKPRW